MHKVNDLFVAAKSATGACPALSGVNRVKAKKQRLEPRAA